MKVITKGNRSLLKDTSNIVLLEEDNYKLEGLKELCLLDVPASCYFRPLVFPVKHKEASAIIYKETVK